MITSFTREQVASAGPDDLGNALERGQIVYFPECPLELPAEGDLEFLRTVSPRILISKNLSYHPEAGRIRGVAGTREEVGRTQAILKAHSARVQDFLRRSMPNLTQEWQVATSSFRPLEERGRNLSPHASNELVHVDAGAYGATHGDRILRFFVNVNTSEDRVWASKGTFPELYRRFGREAGLGDGSPRNLRETALDRVRSGAARALGSVFSSAHILDSSPYDREMRRFHNFMKDTPAFQSTVDNHREFRFRPYSAWMVFTDMVSHACVKGQFALVDTFVIRVANCRLADLAPIHVLEKGCAG